MIIIDTQDRKAREQLSKKAAKHFEKFTEAQVYVNGGIESGSLIALKWGRQMERRTALLCFGFPVTT